MKAYEVFLNGRHLVTAGTGLNGVLSTTVSVGKHPRQQHQLRQRSTFGLEV